MKDTPPDVEAMYRDMLMAKSPGERVAMATRMFQTAKKLVIAGLRDRYGDLGEADLREKLFLIFYGGEFSEEERGRIVERVRNGPDR
jgi:hypothetical protein